MAPVPLEGHQTPISNNVAQEGSARGGNISLGVLIEFIVQRTYHELTVLAELLPRKTDMERKVEIFNFSVRTRQLFVRLLALVKWANSASKVDKSAHIMAFLDKQSMLFVETADMLARMSRETLVHARLPNFHIPAAVEVLTTGTYSRLPSCIRDKIVPPDPITPVEKKTTLQRLNQVIQHRLVTGNLLPQMRNLKIEAGRVTFHVDHEFEVSLTVMGDCPNIPWRLLDIDILVEDKETGDGKALVHSLQVHYIHQVLQARLQDHPNPLHEVYSFLHYFCQSLQLEVLYSQTMRLCMDRLDGYIHVDEYIPGKSLTVSYWRELTSKDPRSELGYRLIMRVDDRNPARPLSITHIPTLGVAESKLADRAVRSELLSIERLLVHTIHLRTKQRLNDLKAELQTMLKDVECTVAGSPAVLSVTVVQPSMRAESLLITVDTHTGMLQAHVPKYDPPLLTELEAALNSDRSRLTPLISDLRYWITQRRCEKTLQHLPATPHERLPLLHYPDHPLSKIGRHRMFIRLHRHRNTVLIVEMKEKENSPTEMDYTFYLAVVKQSSIEDDPHDDTIETEIPKMYLKVLTLIEFDSFVTTHGPFTPVDDHEKGGKRKLGWKVDLPSKALKPAYFIPELAHVVALCDERIPFVTLSQELSRREIAHQGLQVEANATALGLKLVQLPPPSGVDRAAASRLSRLVLSVTVRAHCPKGTSKSWVVEFVLFGSPLPTQHPKEQGMRRPVYFQYDMLPAEQVGKTVDALLSDWAQIVHLYTLVEDLAEYFRMPKYNISSVVTVKSYSYSKLVLGYGPDRAATVTVQWNPVNKAYTLVFGGGGNCMSAHSIMREQLEGELNREKNLVQLIQLLNDTYAPLVSISKLPAIPQLGVHNARPQIPVQTFTVIAESTTVIRVAYLSLYCLEIRLRGGGLVAIRDAAYSRFDRASVLNEFTPTPGLKGPQHQSFGSSPATSFNLASPPSLPPNINPSPSMLPHPSPSSGFLANSPSTMPTPSPMPISSPGPLGHSPAAATLMSHTALKKPCNVGRMFRKYFVGIGSLRIWGAGYRVLKDMRSRI
ncbi:mediator of RNA polymerase II transcription subunit 14 [Halyomorpha halys]|uniref:mediator of RNA polymerase II transcription subunit 14 n=1 Tax=Halyomorpha halys TaxID=286706 RepID=UPI0034D2B457